MSIPEVALAVCRYLLGFGDAAWMGNPKGEVWWVGNPKGEVWDALLERGMGKEKWGCILGNMPKAARNVALLEMPKYFASRFS